MNIHLNACGVEGAASLSQTLRHNSKLKSLDVSSNIIGDDGVNALCGALSPKQSQIEMLQLAGNEINCGGALFVANMLRQYTTLLELDLSCNNLGPEVKEIALALHDNTTLTRLSLARNAIGDEGLSYLAGAIRAQTARSQRCISAAMQCAALG